MAKYTIRPINTGFTGKRPVPGEVRKSEPPMKDGNLEPGAFYTFHFSLYKYLEKYPVEIGAPGGVLAFLLEGDGKKILIDTGMCETERANKYHHKGGSQLPGEAIDEALINLGIQPEEIDYVLFTHLHWDHSSNCHKFTNARFFANQTEYEFALDPIPLYYKSYEASQLGIEADFKKVKMETFLGETEILPGIVAFDTPGHSPGHVAFEVDTEDGKYIIAGDACFGLYTFTPFPEETLMYDITPPGRFCDIVGYWKSARTLRERCGGDINRILLCHEGSLLESLKDCPVIGLKQE